MNIELIFAKKFWLYFQNLAMFYLFHCCQATVMSPLHYYCNSLLSDLSPKWPLWFTLLQPAGLCISCVCQALCFLRFPALAIISFWNTFPPDVLMACFLSSILSLSIIIFQQSLPWLSYLKLQIDTSPHPQLIPLVVFRFFSIRVSSLNILHDLFNF